MIAQTSIRHCFHVVAHDDETRFNVFLRADRFYVDTPNLDEEKLARWKGRERSTTRSGGTATLWACCDSVTQTEAEDAILEVWLEVKYPRKTAVRPVSAVQQN